MGSRGADIECPRTRQGDKALLESALKEVLRLDIRSTHQGRGKKEAGEGNNAPFEVHFDCLRVRFLTHEGQITVVDIADDDVHKRRYRN